MLLSAVVRKRRISVTGILTPSVRSNCKQLGFTLWEILVVVIIITVTVSVILLSSNLASDGNKLETHASQLNKLLRLLYQEAIFENKNYAISLHHQGFRVIEYNGEEWLFSEQQFFRKVNLEAPLTSDLLVSNRVVASVSDESAIPHIWILASGEMSPFEWTISDPDVATSITLSGDIFGKIVTGQVVQGAR